MPTSPAVLPSPIVDADWLSAHLGEVVVADVRWYSDGRSGRAAYGAGHLPGAVFVDLDRDLAGPPTASGGRHPLPDPGAFAAALSLLGIGEGTPVVAYDDAGGSVAARLWWLLHILGEPAAVLDGGLAAWSARSGVLSADAVVPVAVERPARPWPDERIAEADEVEARRSSPGTVLLDARAAARYEQGDPAIDPRPGHIPGARSAPWSENLDPATGRFRSTEALRAHFAELGADATDSVIAYCGSGVTACHDLLALELAGVTGTALFPGSWSAWGADPDRPAETGADSPQVPPK